jgi:general secretion pathway protein G
MNQLNKNAFTMIELIFVIVVLGILSSIALPKFGSTKKSADVVKGKADIATIRSAILNERQTRIIKGCSQFIANGTSATDNGTCPGLTMKQLDAGGLFGGVLQYPMPNKANADGAWSAATPGSGTYVYRIDGTDVTFTYTAGTVGTFTCSTAGATGAMCKSLIE